MSGDTKLVGSGSLKRVIIPSSFAATISSERLPKDRGNSGIVDFPIADFRIGKGGWIVQAKATIRESIERVVTVQFRLKVSGGGTAEDRAKASASGFGYASIVAVVGVHVSTAALVELTMTVSGDAAPEMSDIVVTAIHQEDLLILEQD